MNRARNGTLSHWLSDCLIYCLLVGTVTRLNIPVVWFCTVWYRFLGKATGTITYTELTPSPELLSQIWAARKVIQVIQELQEEKSIRSKKWKDTKLNRFVYIRGAVRQIKRTDGQTFPSGDTLHSLVFPPTQLCFFLISVELEKSLLKSCNDVKKVMSILPWTGFP